MKFSFPSFWRQKIHGNWYVQLLTVSNSLCFQFDFVDIECTSFCNKSSNPGTIPLFQNSNNLVITRAIRTKRNDACVEY